MPVVIRSNARNDERSRVGRGVLLFKNGQAVKAKSLSS
jgi:hypothetical protein